MKYGVDVVFAGHEHFYERIKPQNGVHDFTSGGAARLRWGDIDRDTKCHAAGFDEGCHSCSSKSRTMRCISGDFGRRQDRGFRHDPAATATGAEHGPGGAVEDDAAGRGKASGALHTQVTATRAAVSRSAPADG